MRPHHSELESLILHSHSHLQHCNPCVCRLVVVAAVWKRFIVVVSLAMTNAEARRRRKQRKSNQSDDLHPIPSQALELALDKGGSRSWNLIRMLAIASLYCEYLRRILVQNGYNADFCVVLRLPQS